MCGVRERERQRERETERETETERERINTTTISGFQYKVMGWSQWRRTYVSSRRKTSVPYIFDFDISLICDTLTIH